MRMLSQHLTNSDMKFERSELHDFGNPTVAKCWLGRRNWFIASNFRDSTASPDKSFQLNQQDMVSVRDRRVKEGKQIKEEETTSIALQCWKTAILSPAVGEILPSFNGSGSFRRP
jgi:hypothetical protein